MSASPVDLFIPAPTLFQFCVSYQPLSFFRNQKQACFVAFEVRSFWLIKSFNKSKKLRFAICSLLSGDFRGNNCAIRSLSSLTFAASFALRKNKAFILIPSERVIISIEPLHRVDFGSLFVFLFGIVVSLFSFSI